MANNSAPIATGVKLQPVLIFFGGLFLLGFLAAIIWGYSWAMVMVTVEWILGCFAFGNLIGLLFGITKGSQGTADGTNANVNYKPVINQNLIEIADWLTKIIVGLSLVKLTRIPPYLSGMAHAFADQGPGINYHVHDAVAFGYGVIVSYFVIGFLFGYLMMRLYINSEIALGDKGVLDTFVKDQLAPIVSQLDTVKTNQVVIAQGNAQIVQQNATPEDKTAAIAQIKTLAAGYNDINNADYIGRISEKRDYAAKLVNFAKENLVGKQDLVDLLAANVNDGLLITLATMVNLSPEVGDTARLLNFGAQANQKYVRYRILIAIGSLIDGKFLQPGDTQQLLKLVDGYRKNADASLLEKIEGIEAMLKNYKV